MKYYLILSLKVIKEIKEINIINKIVSSSKIKHFKHSFNEYSLRAKYVPHLPWAFWAYKDGSWWGESHPNWEDCGGNSIWAELRQVSDTKKNNSKL